MATLAGVIVAIVVAVPAFLGSAAEKDAVRVEESANVIAQRAADEGERVNRDNLDRDRKKYASMVTMRIVDQPTESERTVGAGTTFVVEDRAPKDILSLELLASHDAAMGGDGMPDGTVSLSTSRRIPACTAVTFAIPEDFDLADHEDGALRGQRLIMHDLAMLFFQDSAHWQLLYDNGALAGESDADYSVRRSRTKTDVGQLVYVGEEPLGDCGTGD
ncbi:hypothetical protein [Phytohabitans rumicis]|uniref:hypothetical protein n=1 Tax=Phytohabitans rumicis TaxID=1076125 RepID=UPI0015658D74|nr:hypothetical protein [Phytohabitans rumicis]